MSIDNNSQSILIVDDNILNLELLAKILSRGNFKVSTAIDGIEALKQIEKHLPELIILDVMMPNLDGFETCQRLKESSSTSDIPIIFMTALSEIENKVKGFSLGAVDYITKPFQRQELLVRVKSQLELGNFRKTLEAQNHLLKIEIDKKYQAEVSLLGTNEQLEIANTILAAEIEQRIIIEAKLKQEVQERKAVEQQVKKSLKQKELLLKEIHHRVKNNLFVVASLLEFQAEYINDPKIIKMLDNSQNRITSMALIHEQLYCTTDLEKIDFSQYITALTNKIASFYNLKNINFVIDSQAVNLNIETANPCGLIINELIANALEHAFGDRSEGNIGLSFKKDDLGRFTLIVKDDGLGFPENKNFYKSESLGLELVCTLVEQLEGEIKVDNDNGTQIEITFLELNYGNRF